MIQYSLVCDTEHRFDAWFRNAEAYEDQAERALLSCPVCGSARIEKALMAPSVATRRAEAVPLSAGHPDGARLRKLLQAFRDKVVSEADYVGDRFAEEARKIHFSEIEPHGIYGEATREEVKALLEEGVDFLPLPTLPDDHN